MKKIILLCILFSLLASHLYGESNEDEKEYKSKAEALLLKQCNEEKNIQSCSELAFRYDNGDFPSEDGLKSSRIYGEKDYKFSEEACNKGDFKACQNWHYYLSGKSTIINNKKDLDKAAKVKDKIRMLVKKQLTSNDPITLYSLGQYYWWNDNNKKADKLFKSSCELGYYQGCLDSSNTKLYKKGILMAEKLCNEGKGEACWKMADTIIDDDEHYDPKESERKYQFYKKGCSLGHAKSCIETAALCY